MTLREFIAWHPGQALDVMTPEGRTFLEPNHIESLLKGKPVIVCANGPKKASYVDADQMLGYYVISAYQTHNLVRLNVTYDPIERQEARFSELIQRRLSL